jgi:hypothetical protein
MSENRSSKAGLFLITTLFFAILATYFGIQDVVLRLRVEFARDQMAILEDMRDQALKAEPKQAVGCLKYAVVYYPSGTKQTSGSALDHMVEQTRAEMIRQIIADLREKTGDDLGNDPQRWIDKYGGD